jgi:hypothetical protein
VFELVRTIELDVELQAHAVAIRLELFRASGERDIYRCRLWRRTGDTETLTEWSPVMRGDYERFAAPSPAAALQVVLRELNRCVESEGGRRRYSAAGQ